MFVMRLLLLLLFLSVCHSLRCKFGAKWSWLDLSQTCDGEVCVGGTAIYSGIKGLAWGCVTVAEAVELCGDVNKCNQIHKKVFKGYDLEQLDGCCCNDADECNANQKQESSQTEAPNGFLKDMGAKIANGFAGFAATIANWFD